ncbi:MAG: hypothetical protein KA735_01870 [Burkholderiaceae bacterium]|nr:hypothetical protein [Burkholderiaceae bacterium]
MNKLLISTLFCALATLAGCSTTTPTASTDAVSTTSNPGDTPSNSYMTPPGLCDADPAQSLLGKAPQPDIMAQAKQLSGAKQLRTLLPGQVMTMEYNPERLNILVGDSDTITRINCG